MENPQNTKRPLYSALYIAKYFIWKSNKEGRKISNKKLQKLLYYSQAWNLVFYNKPLFKEKIEAWIHGPAIRKVYEEYKKYGYQPIEERVDEKDIKDLKDNEVLESVWETYGEYDADYLELLTHSEKPWQVTREELEFSSTYKNEIPLDIMYSFYKQLLEQTKNEKPIKKQTLKQKSI